MDALAEQDAKALSLGIEGRAEGRALMSAAMVGSGVGLALGALLLTAGLGRVAFDHGSADSLAEVGQAMRGPIAADPAAAAEMARAQLAETDAAAGKGRELDCLTQAVYFEARGESVRGQAAVATVIMNRVKNPHFPKTVCGVVYQGASHHGCQFSFACDGSVERVADWDAWEQARKVAARALSGVVLRDVGSATHFHTTAVDPEWGSRMLRVAQVGLHVFYRFNPHAPPPIDDDDAEDPPQLTSAPASAAPTLRLAAAVTAPTEAAKSTPEARPAQPAKADAPTQPATVSAF